VVSVSTCYTLMIPFLLAPMSPNCGKSLLIFSNKA
jgi:hypothetical protein